MGKKTILPRKERRQLPVLLARTGTGEYRQEGDSGGDQGQEEAITIKGDETEEIKSAKKAGKDSSETTSTHRGRGRKAGRRGGYNLVRKSAGGDQGEDKVSGRCARELGIVWVDGRCEESPSKAHYYVGRDKIDKGQLFECKHCHSIIWLPMDYESAQKLSTLMILYGESSGYCKMLDRHPAARKIIAKVQDLKYLRKLPKEQFLMALAAVMTDNNYPYEVEVEEEEVL